MSFLLRLILCVFCVNFLPLAVFAQSAQSNASAEPMIYPQIFRFEENTDYSGGDIRQIFQTSLEYCEKACRGEQTCQAITYNARSEACFLKSGDYSVAPFDGAYSAQLIDLTPEALATMKKRVGNLAFLPGDTLKDAVKAYYEMPGRAVEIMTSPDQNGYYAASMINEALASDNADPWFNLFNIMGSSEYNDERRALRSVNISRSDVAIIGYLTGQEDQTEYALSRLALTLANDDSNYSAAIRVYRYLNEKTGGEWESELSDMLAKHGPRVENGQIKLDGPKPRLCLNFNTELVQNGVNYSDYIVTDIKDLASEVSDNTLCLSGLQNGQHLSVTVRAGLPAADGEVTQKNVTLEYYVPDQPPSVSFAGNGYVLPKGKSATIPISSVNAQTAEIAIYKVPGNNLNAVITSGAFLSPVENYQSENLSHRDGVEIWRGEADLKTELNKEIVTALPIQDVIGSFEPGVYVILANVKGARNSYEFDYDTAATQWFVISDIGLTTYAGPDNFYLVAQSLDTNAAASGLQARLYARNNTILGETVTDADGVARFEGSLLRGMGGNAPSFVSVSSSDDFVFLDLNAPAFDFSDRGVKGRADPGEIDIFTSFDRGIYRPGEVVNTTILARDREAKAIDGLPLWAIYYRPDGREYEKRSLSDAGAGGRTNALKLDPGAMRGKWTLKVMTEPDGEALATNTFQVDDFVPQRIDFTTELPDGTINPLDPPEISLQAEYLFGGVGANLAFSGTVRREAVTELAEFPGFTFGSPLAEENVTTLPFGKGMMTDKEGRLAFKLPLPAAAAKFQPEVMKLSVALSEGTGLPVERRFERPIRPAQDLIGIKPLFEGAVPDGDKARFELVAINPEMQRIDMKGVKWAIRSIDHRYQWYRDEGEWKYKTTKFYETVATGTVDISTGAVLEIPVDWGDYELSLTSPVGDTVMASTEFYAGWYNAGASLVQSPDRLSTGLDTDHYQLGDTVRLRVKAPADGMVQIAVMNSKMISLTRENVSKGDAEITLKIGESWGSGAYILTSFIQASDARKGRNPVRAVGVNYVPVSLRDQKLEAQLTVPEMLMPRKDAVIGIDVANANGQPVYASLAIVDEGILNLTGYKAPDPVGYYFDQRRLGFEMRDIYGRLINGYLGETGALRQGGDFEATSSQGFSGPIQEDNLAIFTGPVQLDQNGHVDIPVSLPEFNGSVRIMAVLWSEHAIGAVSQDARVRDPIVILPNMSRFIAPGDQAEFSVDLTHAYGPTGEAQVMVAATDPLGVDFSPVRLSFGEGEKHHLTVPVKGLKVGDASLVVTVMMKSGEEISRTVPISVMRNDNPISAQTRVTVAAGQSVPVPPTLISGFAPDAQLEIVSGLQARLNVGALVRALDEYPYGCSEQLVSRAEPLLAFGDRVGDRELVRKRLQDIITEIAGRQNPSGSFGYWRAGGYEDMWLNAYVTDFLVRARQAGADIPERMLDTALLSLSNAVRAAGDFDEGHDYIPYSLYVLARAGRASIGDLRYYNDVKRDAFYMASSSAQLGVALALYGETERAKSALNYALNRSSRFGNRSFSSRQSDEATVRALAIESGLFDAGAMLSSVNFSALPTSGSTQDQAWALRLAYQLAENPPADFDIFAKGKTYLARDVASGTATISNPSVTPQEFVMSIRGTPVGDVASNSNGYKIRRFLFDINGGRVDPAQIRQNQQVVVLLKVTPETDRYGRLIINDPLPAGLQIENPSLLGSGDVAGLPWLKDLADATHSEFHADRFIAAINWEGMNEFRLAYVTRATTPGRYRYPAAKIEDMYVPTMNGNSKSSTITVAGK